MKPAPTATQAVEIAIEGVVQGVGFRPYVYRLANDFGVRGWVLNGGRGVRVHAEAAPETLRRFIAAISEAPPPAAQIASLATVAATPERFETFVIRASRSESDVAPTVRISPDLCLCDECRSELFDPAGRRYGYPYVNCTNCGPRYSVVLGLPYDRPNTTMREWPLCAACRSEYEDPGDRRFHAQPVACPVCGPEYALVVGAQRTRGPSAIELAAQLLRDGSILALKGIGGYHLACDARAPAAVEALRERKYRKERPFAVMVRDLATAHELVELDAPSETLLLSNARPIVLAPSRVRLAGVAPENTELGVMLPYAPLHELLFAFGAPDVLVLTSANRSSEPIAYRDDEALSSLAGIADAFLIGERPIARRLDDSIVRHGPAGTTVLRRARGLAPQAVATLPPSEPILALGADLKNTVALVVAGQAFASQHLGDLSHYPARVAFEETVRDLCAMYGVDVGDVLVAHDLHPQYYSTEFAATLGARRMAVQHHRAHVASVLAERGAWDTEVTGFAFDGTGYGDDGAIWGGEVFRGTLAGGLERVAHLRTVALPGGDAAARFPLQAAAGFLAEFDPSVAWGQPPFEFSARFFQARELVAKAIRTFPTSSVGRLFDAVAALVGFTREQSFEGQAPMWLEHVARQGRPGAAYAFGMSAGEFDSRPVLTAIVADRLAGRPASDIALGFHRALADAILALAEPFDRQPVVVSGGVFQNNLLMRYLFEKLGERLWINHRVPANDGGISLGQAAFAALTRSQTT